jgi:hypothetical protein
LAKNPKNGGTPAIEKKAIIKTLLKKVVAPKLENEYKVLVSTITNCSKVKKTKKRAKL